MSVIVGFLVLKLLTLAGSVATTAWLVSFFAFEESLAPHRLTLLLGGFAAIAVGEGIAYLWGARLKAAGEREEA